MEPLYIVWLVAFVFIVAIVFVASDCYAYKKIKHEAERDIQHVPLQGFRKLLSEGMSNDEQLELYDLTHRARLHLVGAEVLIDRRAARMVTIRPLRRKLQRKHSEITSLKALCSAVELLLEHKQEPDPYVRRGVCRELGGIDLSSISHSRAGVVLDTAIRLICSPV